jgi:hypothetical protein
MKLRKSHLLLLCLCLSMVMLTGCTATWITALGAAIPGISALITAIATFVAALAGKTVSASVAAAIKKYTADALAELQNLASIISAVAGAVTQDTIGKISVALNAVLTNLQGILTSANITDSATLSKLSMLIGLGVAAVQAALALIPLIAVKNTAPLSTAELTVLDHHMKGFKAEYHVIQSTLTGQVDVDAALAEMPKSI